jgi:tetratricopeptide (TPR) repeat protein
LADRLYRLLETYNQEEADALLSDAKAANDVDVMASVRIAQAREMDLSTAKRLQMLEDSLRVLSEMETSDEQTIPTKMAIASLLIESGNFKAATKWLKQIVDAKPSLRWAVERLVQCYFETNRWKDAATFLEQRIALAGKMPGTLTLYGRALLESGKLSEAVTALVEAKNLAGDNINVSRGAMTLLEKALGLGGKLQPSLPEAAPETPITIPELEQALAEYSRIIATQRKYFWIRSGDGHKWVSKPERLAQGWLYVFLASKFGSRVVLCEEVSAGAGRIDLFVQSVGGLSFIIELKMCGHGHSSSCAADGDDQIIHYMENKSSRLGFLIVLDARLDTWGQLQTVGSSPFTIKHIFSDVRPTISKRRNRQTS